VWWSTIIIPSKWEAEVGELRFEVRPQAKTKPYQKNKFNQQAGGVAQG
jgi:hypothetical protein